MYRILRPERTFSGRQVPCSISCISRLKSLLDPYSSLRSVRSHDICSDLRPARVLQLGRHGREAYKAPSGHMNKTALQKKGWVLAFQ